MISSRAQEKEELRDLNKRLTTYIEKVRLLESDNNFLKSQVSNHLDYSEKKVKDIKTLYDEKLENAKVRINSLANENMKFCIEKDRFKSVLEEANLKLAKRDKDAKNWEERANKGEALAIEFKSRYESLLFATQDNHDELINLKSAYNDLVSQLFTTRTNLESQVYLRTELENKITTLKETLAFKTAMYEKEINLLKDRHKIEIEQIISTTDEEEESRFLSELQKIRDETDEKKRRMNNEIEKKYLFKINEAESNLKRQMSLSNSLRDEIIFLEEQIEELKECKKENLVKIASFEQKISVYEENIRHLLQRYDRDIAEKFREIEIKSKELQDISRDYHDLRKIKLALDTEIKAYRAMLESEESRLNISKTSNSVNNSESGFFENSELQKSQSSKKRRLSNEEESEIYLESQNKETDQVPNMNATKNDKKKVKNLQSNE